MLSIMPHVRFTSLRKQSIRLVGRRSIRVCSKFRNLLFSFHVWEVVTHTRIQAEKDGRHAIISSLQILISRQDSSQLCCLSDPIYHCRRLLLGGSGIARRKNRSRQGGHGGRRRGPHQRAPGRRPPPRPVLPALRRRRADELARPALAPPLEVRARHPRHPAPGLHVAMDGVDADQLHEPPAAPPSRRRRALG